MSKFGRAISPYIQIELRAALAAETQGQSRIAFEHLERAHVLGQSSTIEHVRVHWYMLLWSLRQCNVREFLGQVIRIIGASTKTAVGFVPHGNTGGSNVSPFQCMPVLPELEALIQRAHSLNK